MLKDLKKDLKMFSCPQTVKKVEVFFLCSPRLPITAQNFLFPFINYFICTIVSAKVSGSKQFWISPTCFGPVQIIKSSQEKYNLSGPESFLHYRGTRHTIDSAKLSLVLFCFGS
jgi:hypothetical protein